MTADTLYTPGREFLLPRCPHCSIANPRLSLIHECQLGLKGEDPKLWFFYACASCCCVTSTWTWPGIDYTAEYFPKSRADLSSEIPEPARSFLKQAIESIHSPTASVLVCASSIDAMLKAKGLKDGSLFTRIDKAKTDHLITEEMAAWAHEIRLDANDQRHADEAASLPTKNDAEKVIDFTEALAQFLFVLPARVKRGRIAKVPQK